MLATLCNSPDPTVWWLLPVLLGLFGFVAVWHRRSRQLRGWDLRTSLGNPAFRLGPILRYGILALFVLLALPMLSVGWLLGGTCLWQQKLINLAFLLAGISVGATVCWLGLLPAKWLYVKGGR